MKYYTEKQAQRNGILPKGELPAEIDRNRKVLQDYRLEDTLGARHHATRFVTSTMKNGAILFIANSFIWPSYTNQGLAKLLWGLDKVSGKDKKARTKRVCNVVTFDKGERDLLQAFLGMALISCWETYLLSPDGELVWFFSHDDFFNVSYKGSRPEIEKFFAEYDVF